MCTGPPLDMVAVSRLASFAWSTGYRVFPCRVLAPQFERALALHILSSNLSEAASACLKEQCEKLNIHLELVTATYLTTMLSAGHPADHLFCLEPE